MTLSRRTLLTWAAAVALTPTISNAKPTIPRSLLETHLRGTKTPGMAVLVIRGFHLEREQVIGVRRLGSKDPVRRGDRWHLGSDAKAMVATMIARLVERDVLDWSRPLVELLPPLAKTMHASYRDVTLPELLSHRSGLAVDLFEKDVEFQRGFHKDRRALSEQRIAYLTRALSDPPVAEKRKAFSYSNTGYIAAAAAAEWASKRSFETLMAEELFVPLGMTTAGFALFGDTAGPVGHRDDRVGDRLEDVLTPMFAPAGGIMMSLQDWGRFCIDQMQGAHGRGLLLKQQTYQLLHTAQGDTGFAALGWGYLPNAFERRGPALFHAGSDGNWTALAMLFPETGNGVLVAANAFTSMQGDRAANEAMRAIVPLIAEPAPSSK